MTEEQYDASIATGEVQLNGFGQKFTHFTPALYFFFPGAIILVLFLYGYLIGTHPLFDAGGLLFIGAPFILGFLLFRLQKSRLRFKVVETNLNLDEIKAIIEQVAVDLKWEGIFTGDKIYEAKTDPSFFSGSWGEQITILISDNKVFVNSICDLEKRSSMVSMGRNRKNENGIIERIYLAE